MLSANKLSDQYFDILADSFRANVSLTSNSNNSSGKPIFKFNFLYQYTIYILLRLHKGDFKKNSQTPSYNHLQETISKYLKNQNAQKISKNANNMKNEHQFHKLKGQ